MINSPSLYNHSQIAAFQLLVWLFLRPAAWRLHLESIDSTLSPQTALVELTRHQWRNPKLSQLFFMGYGLLPISFTFLTCVGVFLSTGHLSFVVVVGCGLGLATGLLIGLVANLSAGIVAAALAPILWGGVLAPPGLLVYDLAMGLRVAIVLGVTSALTAHIIANFAIATVPVMAAGQIARQIGGFFIGLIVSGMLFYLVLDASNQSVSLRQGGSLADNSLGISAAAVPALCFGAATAWRSRHWQTGLRIGVVLFWMLAFAFGNNGAQFHRSLDSTSLLIDSMTLTTLVYLILFLLPFVLVERIAGDWAGALAGALGTLSIFPLLQRLVLYYQVWPNLLLAALFVILGFSANWWLPFLLYPLEAAWNTILLRTEETRSRQHTSLLPLHAVFWHETQFLPLYGLDEHLVLISQRQPEVGRSAIDMVSNSRQRWAAQAAQIELDARRLEQCVTIDAIAEIESSFAAKPFVGPASTLLHSLHLCSRDVTAALHQFSSYNQRIILQKVENDLNTLHQEITRSNDLYARRFQPVIMHWARVIAQHIRSLTNQAIERQEIQNPYVVGNPIIFQQSVFVGRTEITARIEHFLSAPDHAALLLYGQRRMGKTSLLYNLRYLLPNHIVPLMVDLQGPISASSDHASLIFNLTRKISDSAKQQEIDIPALTRQQVALDPFTSFDEWLDRLEASVLAHNRSKILLSLDEFEVLDEALIQGRFSESLVLGTLRHMIQHRHRFCVMLSGSHTLEEFQRWAGYLINAQVLHLSYLQEAEACQLIEAPTKEFTLAYMPEAVLRILKITRSHPYLIQLLCSEIVILKNQQKIHERLVATVEDVEASAITALSKGNTFFSYIGAGQFGINEHRLLKYIAEQGEGQRIPYDNLCSLIENQTDLQQSLALLNRREVLEAIDGCYSFQIELVRRWFAQWS